MSRPNFNLLDDKTLTRLGFSKNEIALLEPHRPFGSIFDLLAVDGLDRARVGTLLAQGIGAGSADNAIFSEVDVRSPTASLLDLEGLGLLDLLDGDDEKKEKKKDEGDKSVIIDDCTKTVKRTIVATATVRKQMDLTQVNNPLIAQAMKNKQQRAAEKEAKANAILHLLLKLMLYFIFSDCTDPDCPDMWVKFRKPGVFIVGGKAYQVNDPKTGNVLDGWEAIAAATVDVTFYCAGPV